MNLECKVSLREGTQELLTEIGEIIKPRVGSHFGERDAIELVGEIAKAIVERNVEVIKPVYINPYFHDITIPEHDSRSGCVSVDEYGRPYKN